MTYKIRAALVAILLSVFAAPVQAFMVMVQADRITIGTEYLLRCTAQPDTLIVPAGTVTTLPADVTYGCIEVQNGGTLKVPRDRNTKTRFTTLIVLPGGTLDAGTPADPIPCTQTVEFIIRDVPIDTTKDPFQWGNGLVNAGRQTRVGCKKTPFVEAAGTLAAGATTITLATAPVGWQVGDELLIPDMESPTGRGAAVAPKREAPVTIKGLSGTTLVLSKPLDFAHANITDPQGVVVLRPRVANLTRNISLRSENPTGTPGHTVDVGEGTTWDVRYNQFSGMGRTKIVPLEDTVLATGHIGTNQRGKYTEHHHHVQSCPSCVDEGNVSRGLGTDTGSKWGLAVHNTSDTRIEGNIIIDFPGAGFATEDGYEVRNVFKKNFAAYNVTYAFDAAGNRFEANNNIDRICPGCEGTGFWLHGVMNTFDGNEAWNNFTSGFNLMNQQQPTGMYPSLPGGPPDTALSQHKDVPIAFTNNVAVGNVIRGIEIWGTAKFPNVNMIAAHNIYRQIEAIISDGVHMFLQNPIAICTVGANGHGIDSSVGYVSSFRLEGGQVSGCAVGIVNGGSGSGMTIIGSTLQNEVNIERLPPKNILFQNVMHLPLGNYPHQYVVFRVVGQLNGNPFSGIWDGVSVLPTVGGPLFFPNRGSEVIVKNWQGTGKDYRLLYNQSLAQYPAWYSAENEHAFNPPVKGLTMQQSWDTFGISFFGDVIKEADAVKLDGLVGGVAREGLAVTLGPPRAIFTFPTLRAPAKLESGLLRLYIQNTGDPTTASTVASVTIDDQDPIIVDRGPDDDDRSFRTSVPAFLAVGTHTVKVGRTKKDSPLEIIPGSLFTGQYCIAPAGVTTCGGTLPPPPVCVAPQVLVNGVCVTPTPPPVDVCPNIAGVQTTVPVGMVLINGQCVTPTPPPPPPGAPAGTYTFICDAAGKCTLTLVKQ